MTLQQHRRPARRWPGRHVAAAVLAASTLPAGVDARSARAEGAPRLDATGVALAYYKVSGESLDFEAAARHSAAAARAPAAARSIAIRAELERLRSGFAATSAAREFTMRVRDRVSAYDRATERFEVGLLASGSTVRFRAFGEHYRLLFVNASTVRTIAVPRAFARDLDAWLRASGRRVTHEVRFRVVGAGDPSGAIAGPRVIRAEIVSSRVIWRGTGTP